MTELLPVMPRYEAYKNSGVEWIGEIPAHWKIYNLGILLEPSSIKNKPHLPLLSITREQGVIQRDIYNQEENNNYIPDDLSNYKCLLKGQFGMNKMKAWQGSYGISDFTGIVSPAYYVFSFIKEIVPSYFNTAIRSQLYISFFGCASDGVRIGQWDLSKTRMKSIPFLIPPLEEQITIANFLDCKTAKIDQAVAIKEKQIRLLKERKQILIQTAVTKGLDPNVPMADSCVEWIGEIPAHWTLKRLKFLFSSTGGGTPSKERKDYWQGNIPWVSPKDMKSDHITTTQDFVTEKGLRESSSNLIEIGSVLLVCRSGILQRKIPIAINKVPVCLNQDMKALTPISKILSEYFLYFVKGNNNFLRAECVKQGATVESIETELFENSFCVVPPLGEQKFIVSHIQTQSAKIDKAIAIQAQMIEKLKEYKATLINAAVTGKIKVPDPAESKVVA